MPDVSKDPSERRMPQDSAEHKNGDQKLAERLRKGGPSARRKYYESKSRADGQKGIIQIGLAGYLIGDAEHAPSRIAFYVIVFAFVTLFYLTIGSGRGEAMSPALLDKTITALIGLATLARGYLFGIYAAPPRPNKQ